jgi:hypothetical protein
MLLLTSLMTQLMHSCQQRTQLETAMSAVPTLHWQMHATLSLMQFTGSTSAQRDMGMVGLCTDTDNAAPLCFHLLAQ